MAYAVSEIIDKNDALRVTCESFMDGRSPSGNPKPSNVLEDYLRIGTTSMVLKSVPAELLRVLNERAASTKLSRLCEVMREYSTAYINGTSQGRVVIVCNSPRACVLVGSVLQVDVHNVEVVICVDHAPAPADAPKFGDNRKMQIIMTTNQYLWAFTKGNACNLCRVLSGCVPVSVKAKRSLHCDGRSVDVVIVYDDHYSAYQLVYASNLFIDQPSCSIYPLKRKSEQCTVVLLCCDERYTEEVVQHATERAMYLGMMSHKLNSGAAVYADLLDAANCSCWWGSTAFNKARECVSAIAKSSLAHEKMKKWREQTGTGFHQALMAGCMSFISWLVCQDAVYAEKLRAMYVVVMDAAAKAFLEHETKRALKTKIKGVDDVPIPQDILGYLTGKKSTKDHNPINALQEKCQLMRWPLPRYSAVQVAGQGYKVEVRIAGHPNVFGWGMGFAKQDAKVEAARMACACFEELPMPKSTARVLDDPRQSRRFQQIIGLLNTDRINAVSGLQEMCQFFKWDMPIYTQSSPDHPPYECEAKVVVCLFGELSAITVRGAGDSKKKAKEESAAKAIEAICSA